MTRSRESATHAPFQSLAYAAGCCLLLLTSVSPAADTLVAYPSSIRLDSVADQHRVIVVATAADKTTRDITGEAKLTIADPNIADLSGEFVIPKAVGKTQLMAKWNDQTTTIDINVADVKPAPPVNFKLDVVPVFTKSGCNAGACHGASRGQDGFRLSLFGFDPAGDYFRVTREMGTRRVNLGTTSRSLLLEKATGAVTHTGGKLFEVDSPRYLTLKRWLDEGARDAPDETPTVIGITLSPPEIVLRGERVSQRMLVTAALSDGSFRDVTDLAVFGTTDAAVAEVDANAVLHGVTRGEAFVSCRYDVHTVGSQALVLPTDDQYEPQDIEGNYIDELIGQKLAKLRYAPSALCTDAEYLRRLTLDVLARLPTVDELNDFLADESPDKRSSIAETLIQRPEFYDQWVAYWADTFLVDTSRQIEKKPAYLYHAWLREQITSGVPIDEVIHSILVAKGSTFTEPQTNFFASEPDRMKVAENVAQACLGIRTQCAKCHNHPFDRWTMDDYYGFAAFFGRIARKREEDYREWVIFRSGANTKHPVTGAVVAPKFLGGDAPEEPAGSDRLKIAADWITSTDNPYFARNIANRVWAHFFGRGIVEPVDDVRVSNPPSNPQLYDALADRLCETDFDVRELALDIVNSYAYQRSSEHPKNAPIQRDFGRASYRRIPAKMLLDCLSQVTENHGKFAGVEDGGPAIKIPIEADKNYFLKSFGQSGRESVCACESTSQPTLSQALHLLNGDSTNKKIESAAWVSARLQSDTPVAEIIKEVYLRCLSREPSEEELEGLKEIVEASANSTEGMQDVFWAVLNSREFVFNH